MCRLKGNKLWVDGRVSARVRIYLEPFVGFHRKISRYQEPEPGDVEEEKESVA